MRQRKPGQSIVEMGLLLPLMLIILFGIIDFGYYIYGYATVYQAAREAANVAANAPPYPQNVRPMRGGQPNQADPCVQAIRNAAAPASGTLFPNMADQVYIQYPSYITDPETNDFLPPIRRRQMGYPIEVAITYPIEPLTPLWQLVPVFGESGVITVSTVARRSIEGFGRDPTAEDLGACLRP